MMTSGETRDDRSWNRLLGSRTRVLVDLSAQRPSEPTPSAILGRRLHALGWRMVLMPESEAAAAALRAERPDAVILSRAPRPGGLADAIGGTGVGLLRLVVEGNASRPIEAEIADLRPEAVMVEGPAAADAVARLRAAGYRPGADAASPVLFAPVPSPAAAGSGNDERAVELLIAALDASENRRLIAERLLVRAEQRIEAAEDQDDRSAARSAVIDEVRRRLDEEAAEAERLRRRILAIYDSTSWRLSRPVRLAGRLARRLRGDREALRRDDPADAPDVVSDAGAAAPAVPPDPVVAAMVRRLRGAPDRPAVRPGHDPG